VQEKSRRQSKVLTVINLKGGVGKTHSVWMLTSVCQERSLKTLAIDLDTQANLTGSFLPNQDDRPGVEALFNPASEPDAVGLVRQTRFSHVSIIPSRLELARFDLTNQDEWKRSDSHLSLVEPITQLRGLYDYIVLDCPPRLSLVSFAALCASDYVIVPLEAADWGAQGIMQVSAAIRHVQARYNRNLTLLGYVVSRFKRSRSYQQGYLKQLREQFRDLAFDTIIPDLAQFERSVIDAIPITLHAPSSRAASIARQLFDEVESRIEKLHRGRTHGRKENVRNNAAVAA